MTKIQFRSDIHVSLVRHMAADEYAIEAARASNGNIDPNKPIDPERFINALMQPRHGVPFEHCVFTFFVQCPIFVAREWVKHRMSSMNEMSGRYTKLLPYFYTPSPERKVINVGTKMKPSFIAADEHVMDHIRDGDYMVDQLAWDVYEDRLEMGIANEVARSVLPVSIYTQFYWTVNARSLMNFLAYRVESDDSRVHSYPQWEINQGADRVEEFFAQAMPISQAAFVRAGRVAP